MMNEKISTHERAGMTGWKHALLGATAITLAVGATSAVAIESLGPNEVVTAVSWSTTGGYNFQDLVGGPNNYNETLVWHPVGAPDLPHDILAGTATVTILDLVTTASRSVPIDPIDPFLAEQFNFENLVLNTTDIPGVGVQVDDVDYIATPFASGYTTTGGFLTADMYSNSAPRPYMQANGSAATFDCCDVADQQNIVYGTPTNSGLWLDLDGNGVAESNVETLLAADGDNEGLLNSTLQVADVACPNVLEEVRGECVPATKSMSSSFQIPVPLPTPDMACTGQSFAANAATAGPGERIDKTYTLDAEDLSTDCTNIIVTERVSCTGGDLDMIISQAPAGCNLTDNADGTYTFDNCSDVIAPGGTPLSMIIGTEITGGEEGSCTVSMVSAQCETTILGGTQVTLEDPSPSCQDSLSRTPPPEIVPAISPLGLGALLLGLPLVGGFVARRRTRKG